MQEEIAIGIDVGGTNTRAGIVKDGEILGEILAIETPKTLEKFQEEVIKLIKKLQENYSDLEVKIGLGVPGLIDLDTQKVISCPNLKFLAELKFDQILPGFSPTVRNDVDVALCGEIKTRDLSRESVLLLNLGTGIGSAFYIGGKGSWELNLAAEAGHMKMVTDGEICGCGGHGCLEAYFSGRAITEKAQKEISTEIENVKEVYDLMKSGDETAGKIIKEASRYLGVGVANLVNVLGITRVILGGKISYDYTYFIDDVLEAARENIFMFEKRNFQIEKSELIDKSAVIGAAACSLRQE